MNLKLFWGISPLVRSKKALFCFRPLMKRLLHRPRHDVPSVWKSWLRTAISFTTDLAKLELLLFGTVPYVSSYLFFILQYYWPYILLLNCFIDLYYLVSLDFTLNLPLKFDIVYYSIFYISKMLYIHFFSIPIHRTKWSFEPEDILKCIIFHFVFLVTDSTCSRFRLKI